MIEYRAYETLIKNFAESSCSNDPSHDISHIRRVVRNAEKLAGQEGGDLNVVIPAAWLHDCMILPKNHPEKHRSSTLAAEKAVTFLKSIKFHPKYLNDIHHCIEAHSFSAELKVRSVEASIVQDADRLDALGAVGIARCFSVGGMLNRTLFSDADPFCTFREPDDSEFTLDHFYSKLLKLKSEMKTGSGKIEAEKLTEIMTVFLNQLENEIL